MKQIFHHYTEWEDFQHGMYNEDKQGRKKRVYQAQHLLSDPVALYKQMKRVTVEWVKATEQAFTNPNINHQAFLGQCACCIWKGIHEDETREAWGYLDDETRAKANNVADRVFNEWIEERENPYSASLFD